MLKISRFRTWWRPARKASEPLDDRTVTFLELFYDLVYVVLVAELAHALAAHLDWQHLWQFMFLFSIVWWSWLNGTTYHEYHGNNDIRTRIFTFLQMFAVAGMAVFAHDAMGEGSVGFALFYGLFQLIVSYLWWRLAAHDPEHHQENRGFVIIFSISTAVFFISAFVPTPLRFYLWVFAVTISLIQPLVIMVLRPHALRQQNARPLHLSHALVERFGLFNILVLAEIFVGVVTALTHHESLTSSLFITGGLAMSVAFAMWWLYFDFVSHRVPYENRAAQGTWMYLHLLCSMSIVATGAVILNVVENVGKPLNDIERWILVGSVVVFLLSLVPMMRVIQVPEGVKAAMGRSSMTVLIAAILIGLLGFSNLPTIPLLSVIVLVMLANMVYAVAWWVVVFQGRDTRANEA